VSSHFRVNTILISLVLALTIFISPSAHAFEIPFFSKLFQSEQPVAKKPVNRAVYKANTPTRVKVGVYVLHVGKYDFQDASYKMDFYLIFKCTPVCNNIHFEIMNAVQSSIRLVSSQKGYLIYRVQASLNKTNSLRNYPFDNHTLEIVVENRQLTSDKMIFETDPSITAVDSEASVVGFDLLPDWTAKVTNHYYKVFQQTYSSYTFNLFIKRPMLAGFLKGILPALIILCCNFLALFMKISHTSQRLSIATSTFIAAVVFHLNLTASIPPLGYTTYADMFMLINYLCLFIVLIEVVLTTFLIETKHRPLAELTNTLCAGVIPLFWLVLQGINWYVYNPMSFSNGMS